MVCCVKEAFERNFFQPRNCCPLSRNFRLSKEIFFFGGGGVGNFEGLRNLMMRAADDDGVLLALIDDEEEVF
jgi:hypothetical protein